MEGQQPLPALRPEEEAEALARKRRDAGGRALRQGGLSQGKDGHGAFRDLPGLLPLQRQEGGGAQAHVAVVRHCQRHGDAPVGDAVVVPFLDAQGAGLHGGAAVVPEEGPGPAGLRQVALPVQQRQGGCDLMLHGDLLLPVVPGAKFPFSFQVTKTAPSQKAPPAGEAHWDESRSGFVVPPKFKAAGLLFCLLLRGGSRGRFRPRSAAVLGRPPAGRSQRARPSLWAGWGCLLLRHRRGEGTGLREKPTLLFPAPKERRSLWEDGSCVPGGTKPKCAAAHFGCKQKLALDL